MENESGFGAGPDGIAPPSDSEIETALGSVVHTGKSRRQRRTATVTGLSVLIAVLLGVGINASRNKDEEPLNSAVGGTTVTTVHDHSEHDHEDDHTTSTVRPIDTPEPKKNATFVEKGDDAERFVGLTMKELNDKGFEAHQISYFGTQGQWSLVLVKDGKKRLILTTKNYTVAGGEGANAFYMVDDTSKILAGQTMPEMKKNHWYGIQGVYRNDKPVGGVVMEGVGYKANDDGSYPVIRAWHINLSTLRLDETSVTNLERIIETCD